LLYDHVMGELPHLLLNLDTGTELLLESFPKDCESYALCASDAKLLCMPFSAVDLRTGDIETLFSSSLEPYEIFSHVWNNKFMYVLTNANTNSIPSINFRNLDQATVRSLEIKCARWVTPCVARGRFVVLQVDDEDRAICIDMAQEKYVQLPSWHRTLVMAIFECFMMTITAACMRLYSLLTGACLWEIQFTEEQQQQLCDVDNDWRRTYRLFFDWQRIVLTIKSEEAAGTADIYWWKLK